ncbi:helix-turn-helix transcriptional regulator [Streptomyces collinus]|uniref:helix-turn-helix domain-containing protein n=1 Tax=Streptomyces collinus TaxID=42684 RepID=UPI003632A6A6
MEQVDEDMKARVASLTDAERRCLVLIHKGVSIPRIAYEMHVAEGTAKRLVDQAFLKLGLLNREHLARLADKLGLEEASE